MAYTLVMAENQENKTQQYKKANQPLTSDTLTAQQLQTDRIQRKIKFKIFDARRGNEWK